MKGWKASNRHGSTLWSLSSVWFGCPDLLKSWFKDFFFWGTSVLFLIYDRYSWKGRIILPSFLFSKPINFLEDVHLQGWLGICERISPKSLIHWKKSLEAVNSTVTFCILRCFVVVDIFRVGWTDSRCRLVWTSIHIEKMIVLQYMYFTSFCWIRLILIKRE